MLQQFYRKNMQTARRKCVKWISFETWYSKIIIFCDFTYILHPREILMTLCMRISSILKNNTTNRIQRTVRMWAWYRLAEKNSENVDFNIIIIFENSMRPERFRTRCRRYSRGTSRTRDRLSGTNYVPLPHDITRWTICLGEDIIKFIKLHDPITLVHRARVYKYIPKIDVRGTVLVAGRSVGTRVLQHRWQQTVVILCSVFSFFFSFSNHLYEIIFSLAFQFHVLRILRILIICYCTTTRGRIIIQYLVSARQRSVVHDVGFTHIVKRTMLCVRTYTGQW